MAALYDCEITHVRREPVANRFTYRSPSWLVDLDEVPSLPVGLRWLARFDARDHFGTETTIRGGVDAFLASRDIEVPTGRVLMLANARSFGHVFNPLSVFWVYDVTGALAAVVAEVHNTYGDRHAYLLRPGADGRLDSRLAKQLYVSPFNPVDGEYRISISEPTDRVSVSIRLDRPGHTPFVATLNGTRRTSGRHLSLALRAATTSIRVTTLIRWQGVRLYLRGLRVEPRPVHARQEGV